ncbi:other FunK1 protein kinase, partial [Rhizoctonia solani]
MSVRLSNPIKKSHPPVDARTADSVCKDIAKHVTIQDIPNQVFAEAYLSGSSRQPKIWTSAEQRLVKRIQDTSQGQGKTLFSGYAPLLRLLNCVSEQTFQQLQHETRRKALVFHSGDKCRVMNPFTAQDRCPDIVTIWVESQVFPQIDYPATNQFLKFTWCELATIGEAKTSEHGKYQLTSYLQNHLQLHPELNAVLAFAVRANGYALFYHDAAVFHRSKFSWEPGPLYAFVQKLYAQPFQDPSMRLLDPKLPAWATQIGNDVYLSETPRTIAGPGQRRYTTTAVNLVNDELRNSLAWSYGGSFSRLYTLWGWGAHSDNPSRNRLHGGDRWEVQDENGNERYWAPSGGHLFVARAPVYHVRCVCRDGNIMFAPHTHQYRERCARGDAEVKFVNQVLAKDMSVEPGPTCLIIDLGNGSDLKMKRGQDALTERAGTPRFISRSASSGKILRKADYDSQGVVMPSMEGSLADYRQFMHTTEYQVDDNPGPTTNGEIKFSHRLFHDAESTFWVIVWTLARSIGEGSQVETEPEDDFREFFHTMYRHHPGRGTNDSRSKICSKSLEYWTSILHPDLASLDRMLQAMFLYINPEWAYRPDLNAEHVHEALMRLLLAEIVCIDESGKDISIVIGGRPIPPPLDYTPSLPPSTISSLSFGVSRAQSNSSKEPQTTNSNRSGSESLKHLKKRSKPPAEPHVFDLGHSMQELSLGSDHKIVPSLEESVRRSQLRAKGKLLVWDKKSCNLQAPKLDITL